MSTFFLRKTSDKKQNVFDFLYDNLIAQRALCTINLFRSINNIFCTMTGVSRLMVNPIQDSQKVSKRKLQGEKHTQKSTIQKSCTYSTKNDLQNSSELFSQPLNTYCTTVTSNLLGFREWGTMTCK